MAALIGAVKNTFNRYTRTTSPDDILISLPGEPNFNKLRDDYGEFAVYLFNSEYTMHNIFMAYTLGQLNCIHDSLTLHGQNVFKASMVNDYYPTIHGDVHQTNVLTLDTIINHFVKFTVDNDKPLSVHNKEGRIIGKDIDKILYLGMAEDNQLAYNQHNVDVSNDARSPSTNQSGYYVSKYKHTEGQSEEDDVYQVMATKRFDLLPPSVAYVYRQYFIDNDISEQGINIIQKGMQSIFHDFRSDSKFDSYLKSFQVTTDFRLNNDILSDFVYNYQDDNQNYGFKWFIDNQYDEQENSTHISSDIMRQMLFSSNITGDDNGENVSIIENAYFGDNASPFLPFLVPFEDVQKNLVSTGVYRNGVVNNNNGSVYGSRNSGHSVHNADKNGSPTEYANQSNSTYNGNPFDDKSPWVRQQYQTVNFNQNFNYNATPSATDHNSLRPGPQIADHSGQRANHFGNAPVSNQSVPYANYSGGPQQASNAPSQQPVTQLDSLQQASNPLPASNHPSQLPVIKQINPPPQPTSYNASPIVPYRDKAYPGDSSIDLGNAFPQQHNTQHSQAYVNNPIQPRHVNYKNLPSSNNYNYSVNLGSRYSPIQAARIYGQPQLHSNRPIYQDVSREGYEPSERIYRGYYFDNPLPPISDHAVRIQENHVIKHARPKVRGMH